MILKNLILVDLNKDCRDSFENSSIGCTHWDKSSFLRFIPFLFFRFTLLKMSYFVKNGVNSWSLIIIILF